MTKKLKPSFDIEVYQQDWIPGFAAFHSNGQLKKNAKAHVVLNLGALLSTVADGSIEPKELPYFVSKCLMHEVIHTLEEWAGVEFSEKRVHALIDKYSSKYAKKKTRKK